MKSIVIGAATTGAARRREQSSPLTFAGHVFDENRREFTRGSEAVSGGPQVFDLLANLLRNRTRVVSKDDLIDGVWCGRIVSGSTLTSHINAVRKAIGDTGEEQRLVRTIGRKGYRFMGEVREPDVSESPNSTRLPEFTPQSAAPSVEQSAAQSAAPALAFPDRPSIAVLPFIP